MNLGFDEANTNAVKYYGPVSDLLPGWQVFRGSEPLTNIYFNSLPLDSDAMGLMKEPTPNHYYLYFDTAQTPFSLVQHGDIPAGATKMVFAYSGPFNVTVDGQPMKHGH